ncbi:MAG: TrmH family RNA methyltransferase [Burkholderiales bacterium]|jgi:TrmH family RNA methyltransferase
MSTPQVERIASASNATLKALKRLAQTPDAYREQGRVWLEGDHLLQAALTRGVSLQLAVVTEDAFYARAEWQQLALRAARVLVVSQSAFAAVSGLTTPAQIGGCVAWARSGLEAGLPTVVLDRLQDAGNVGSILRSAAALGVRQVVALKGTAALGSAKVLRAGMGAHFALRLVEGAQGADLDALAVPLLATSSYASECLGDAPLPHPAAWLFGHEGQGLSESLLARCDRTLRIAQPGGEESLNVASAAAICLYEASKSIGPA